MPRARAVLKGPGGGLQRSHWKRWCSAYRWAERTQDWDEFLAQEEVKRQVAERLKARDHRRKALMVILAKSVDGLPDMATDQLTYRDRVEGVRMAVTELRKEWDEDPIQRTEGTIEVRGSGVAVYLPDNRRRGQTPPPDADGEADP